MSYEEQVNMRANYSDDLDYDQIFAWRGAVRSAINGRRGQSFLRDLLAALEAMPEKKLISGKMEQGDCVCAVGALGRARNVDMSEIDMIDEYDERVGSKVAALFNIAEALAREVLYINDEGAAKEETDETRYRRVVEWVRDQIR